MFPAGPPPQAPDQSVPAGPERQPLDQSDPRRTPTASSRSQCFTPDLNHKESPKIYRVECQKEYQKICQIECQKERQNICQKEGQRACQKELLPDGICQKLCENNGSRWGSLEESNSTFFEVVVKGIAVDLSMKTDGQLQNALKILNLLHALPVAKS